MTIATPIWKYTTTALLSILLTVAGAYWARGANAVTHAEVREMIQPDRETLREMRDDLRALRIEQTALLKEVSELKGLIGRRGQP